MLQVAFVTSVYPYEVEGNTGISVRFLQPAHDDFNSFKEAKVSGPVAMKSLFPQSGLYELDLAFRPNGQGTFSAKLVSAKKLPSTELLDFFQNAL